VPQLLANLADRAPETLEAAAGALLGGVALNALRQLWANGAPANLRGMVLVPDVTTLVGVLALSGSDVGRRYPVAVLGATAVAGAAVVDGLLNLMGFDLI